MNICVRCSKCGSTLLLDDIPKGTSYRKSDYIECSGTCKICRNFVSVILKRNTRKTRGLK